MWDDPARAKAIEYLGYSRPADPEKAGQRCAALELSGIEKGLVVTGQPKRVAVIIPRWWRDGFAQLRSTPRIELDRRRSA